VKKPTAIPTTYRGARFRSRLEARWAAMFDSLGWGWAYEPVDLPGYLPDFRVRGELAECRPRESDGWAERACSQLADQCRSGLVLSSEHARPYADGRSSPGVWCEWLSCEGPGSYESRPVWWVACGACGGTSLASEVASDDARGCLDVWAHEAMLEGASRCVFCRSLDVRDLVDGAPGVEYLWRRAGAEVQWRAAGFTDRMFRATPAEGRANDASCVFCLSAPCSCGVP
jgi:hypothetical protein